MQRAMLVIAKNGRWERIKGKHIRDFFGIDVLDHVAVGMGRSETGWEIIGWGAVGWAKAKWSWVQQ